MEKGSTAVAGETDATDRSTHQTMPFATSREEVCERPLFATLVSAHRATRVNPVISIQME